MKKKEEKKKEEKKEELVEENYHEHSEEVGAVGEAVGGGELKGERGELEEDFREEHEDVLAIDEGGLTFTFVN